MAPKQPKQLLVAFKAEGELARLLNQLPNKSAFIRKAIMDQLGQACPLCHGKGAVAPGTHKQFQALFGSRPRRVSDGPAASASDNGGDAPDK